MPEGNCKVCTSFTFPGHSQILPEKAFPVEAWQAAQQSGCYDCGMILDAVQEYNPDWLAKYTQCGQIQLQQEVGVLSVRLLTTLDDKEPAQFQIFHSQGEKCGFLLPLNRFRFHKPCLAFGSTVHNCRVEDPCALRVRDTFFSTIGIIRNTRSDAAFDRISAWLSHCLNDHEICETPGKGFMPRRLLYLGSVGNSAKSRSDATIIRLVESSNHFSRPAPYVALSYCWGQELEGVLTTTKAKLGEFYAGILSNRLSQTVQDAVVVCRGLGMKYLWVDALCIVQDDNDDWQQQAAQMQMVYSKSQITIAVHAASSCKDGFLKEHEFGQPTWQREFWSLCQPPQKSKPEIWKLFRKKVTVVQPPINKRFYLRTGLYHPSFDQRDSYPLMRRGWTLQESILPSRIIHFLGEELAWECNERHFCECGHIEGLLCDSNPLARTKARNVPGPLNLRAWMMIVEDYSKRELSFEKDKLIGILGLAQAFETPSNLHERSMRYAAKPPSGNLSMRLVAAGSSHFTGAANYAYYDGTESNSSLSDAPVPEALRNPNGKKITYLAGIFTASLPRQLLWRAVWQVGDIPFSRRFNPKDKSWFRCSPYLAPTWSWVSVNCPVNYSAVYSVYERSFVKIYTEGSYCTPTEGQLLIEGSLTPVTLRTVQGPTDSDPYYDKGGQKLCVVNSGGYSIYCPLTIVSSSQGGERLVIYPDLPREVELDRGEPGYDCWTYGCCCHHVEGRRFRGLCQSERCLSGSSRSTSGRRSPAAQGSQPCVFKLDSIPRFWCLKIGTYEGWLGHRFTYFLVLERSTIVDDAYQRVGIGYIEVGGPESRNELDHHSHLGESNQEEFMQEGSKKAETFEEPAFFRNAIVERIRIV